MYMDKEFNIYQSVGDARIKSSLVEVDDLIAPTIEILNKKGYFTTFCCSGHFPIHHTNNIVGWGSCFISFKNYDSFKDTEPFPNEFEVEMKPVPEGELAKFVLRKWYSRDNYNNTDMYMEIINTMLDLLSWAKMLPSRV